MIRAQAGWSTTRALCGLACTLFLIGGVPGSAAAQDQALEPLLFTDLLDSDGNPQSDIDAQTLQLYRFPFGFHLRTISDDGWGLRVTFPVSLSAVRVEGVSELGRLVRKLALLAVVPGIELEIPVGDRLRLRPFGEVGFGGGTEGGDASVLYGSGVRARVDPPRLRRVRFTLGGSAFYRKLAASGDRYDGHATFEAALDTQVPLGFSVATRPARGGPYVIMRGFNGLELRQASAAPIELRHQLELGASFSTEPDLRIWRITLPWLAVGYQFGEQLSGVRMYMMFPF